MEKTSKLFKKIGDQGKLARKDGYNEGQKQQGPNRRRRD